MIGLSPTRIKLRRRAPGGTGWQAAAPDLLVPGWPRPFDAGQVTVEARHAGPGLPAAAGATDDSD
eukprot:768461-Hanusia_phi.AAC.1